MKAFIRSQVCPSCGGRHRFCLPPTDPVAASYGYVCPATGRPATVRPWGAWTVFRSRPADAVLLAPLGPTPSEVLGAGCPDEGARHAH